MTLNQVAEQKIAAQAAAKKAKKAIKAAAPAKEKVVKEKLYDNGQLKGEDLKKVVADLTALSTFLNEKGLARSSDRLASMAVSLESRHGSTEKKEEKNKAKIAKLVEQLRKLSPDLQLDEILKAAKAAS